MASIVHQFFLSQALHLKEGRIDAVARAHSMPLVVALPDADPGYVVLSSRDRIERFFRLKYEGLREAGISYLRVAVAETRATAADRLDAMVDWYYLEPSGARAGTTTARYFLERRSGSLCIQMIEFQKLAFPSIVTWFQSVGQPANRTASRRMH